MMSLLRVLGRTLLASRPLVFSLTGAQGEQRRMAGSLLRGPQAAGQEGPLRTGSCPHAWAVGLDFFFFFLIGG